MNSVETQLLLEQWRHVLSNGYKTSIQNTNKNVNGLAGRIRRTTGTPVIFDLEAYKEQLEIQKLLCMKLPKLAELINSAPEIMDGYQWTRGDFIDLYFSHYHLVISKLESFTRKKTDV